MLKKTRLVWVNLLNCLYLPQMRKVLAFLLLILLLLPGHALYAQNRGKASYYAKSLHGRKMASGMTYHRDSLTCAHPTLPFGTKLKVKNLKNGREVVVSVQDRGPHVRGRIIDLSHSAAEQLGMLGHGVVTVEVSSYHGPEIQVPFVAVDTFPVLDFEEAARIERETRESRPSARKLRRMITQKPVAARRENKLTFSEEFLKEEEEKEAYSSE